MKETKVIPFYMVFVDGGNSPSHKHENSYSANAEAERLAMLTRKRTYVLGTITSFSVQKVVQTECCVSETLPF